MARFGGVQPWHSSRTGAAARARLSRRRRQQRCLERSAEEIVGASASGEMPLLLSFALRSGGEMLQAISAPHSAQEVCAVKVWMGSISRSLPGLAREVLGTHTYARKTLRT